MNVRVRTLSILVLVTGFVLGYSVREKPSGRAPFRLTPELLTPVEGPFSGDAFHVDLMFFNDSDEDVTITEASATCGCTNLSTSGQADFTIPVRVAGHTSRPWRATIKTAGQSGDRSVAVSLKLERNGIVEVLSSKIDFHVRVPWKSIPSSLYFQTGFNPEEVDSRTREVTIDIVEDVGLPPAQIIEVLSSNSSVITATLLPQEDAARNEYVLRHKLKISVDEDQLASVAGIREVVTVVPTGTSRHQPLRIPVTLLPRKGEFSIVPDQLTLPEIVVATTRRIVVRSRREIRGTVHVEGIPDNLSLKVTRSKPNLYLVDLTFQKASTLGNCTLTFTESDGGLLIGRIPIRVVR